ncbi:MAG: hypothetical protein FWD37_06170 [Methanomassiliicoccaceae archaeon]|nr:hypothetical protein [Methanomassiliicoccaceae archaeon]
MPPAKKEISSDTEVRRPNTETIAAMEEIEAMIRGDIPKRITTVDELFREFRK